MSSESQVSYTELTPPEIVAALDQQVVGQAMAKRAVANAFRSHWRRKRTPENLQNEIKPKNILMIGPTGVGKTEIARRLAMLVGAPFVKVEATTFTEVGYVGRDVTSIIRDLVDVSLQITRKRAVEAVSQQAEDAAVEIMLELLLEAEVSDKAEEVVDTPSDDTGKAKNKKLAARKKLRKDLLAGKLDDRMMDIEIALPSVGVEIMAPPGMEEMTSQLQNMFQSISSDRKKKRRITVKQAFKHLSEQEAAKLINEDDIRVEALENAEQNGIVFLDEIDKVVRSRDYVGADVSREGVQRDLLPLLEGTAVATRYGSISTDHMLFIASGAFMGVSPSDMISELQGRLPVRVELSALSGEDFYRILLEPDASLTKQYAALLKTEDIELKFVKAGLLRIAEIAYQINEKSDNIGARRLHTVMERLLETVSFSADEYVGKKLVVDADYVNQQLKDIVEDDDLSRWIL